jgi:hypothetical protein
MRGARSMMPQSGLRCLLIHSRLVVGEGGCTLTTAPEDDHFPHGIANGEGSNHKTSEGERRHSLHTVTVHTVHFRGTPAGAGPGGGGCSALHHY